MKLYLTNGKYVGTQEEARLRAKAHGQGWQPEEVPTDKPGLIVYLNALVGVVQVDGAPMAATLMDHPAPVQAPAKGLSLEFDDAWDEMTLSRKAHFAALFCEEARVKLR